MLVVIFVLKITLTALNGDCEVPKASFTRRLYTLITYFWTHRRITTSVSILINVLIENSLLSSQFPCSSQRNSQISEITRVI